MSDTPDPSIHKAAEEQFIAHVRRLLDDPRLTIDTTDGRRAISQYWKEVSVSDRGVELKRTMTELHKPDRALQDSMPLGQQLDVIANKKRWYAMRKPIGRLSVICLSPTRQLLEGAPIAPMNAPDVTKFLRQLPSPPNASLAKVPTTIVLVCTGGFTIEAHELAERTADRTLVLAEPNDAGGWSIHGPPETQAFNDLLDPEAAEEKAARVREMIDEHRNDLIDGGIVAEKLALRGKLPLQAVEAELKNYAKQTSGFVAKRLDGRLVLYREGSAPVASGAASGPKRNKKSGESDMPMIDRIKSQITSLFSHKGEIEKKVAFLSERRTVLSLQRDQGYEDILALEQKDGELREQFQSARAPLTKRRITSQLVQLRKDIERRQQMLQVLNQQVNIVATHLHNLELTQQGKRAELPDTEEIASDAAAAEDMLAKLQADNELADSVSGTVGTSVATAGMTAEEQALFAELEAAATIAPSEPASPSPHAGTEPSGHSRRAVPDPARTITPPRRAEPEAT